MPIRPIRMRSRTFECDLKPSISTASESRPRSGQGELRELLSEQAKISKDVIKLE